MIRLTNLCCRDLVKRHPLLARSNQPWSRELGQSHIDQQLLLWLSRKRSEQTKQHIATNQLELEPILQLCRW